MREFLSDNHFPARHGHVHQPTPSTQERRESRACPPLLALLQVVLLLCLGATRVLAEAPQVLVPYDPAQPLEGQKPDRFYLDYATFQQLWQAAKERRAKAADASKPAAAEKGASVLSALHAARVDGARLAVESRYEVVTRGPDWVEVPFAIGRAGLRTLTLDGAPAALREGKLLIEKSGRHAVVATYDVALPAGWTEVGWDVPAATGSALALSLAMDDPARPEIAGGVPVVESTADGRRTFTAALGGRSSITLKRRIIAQHALAGDPASVQWRTRVFSTPALERIEAAAEFTFRGQERREFQLRLPEGVTPVSFDIPGLESWALRQEGGASTLALTLAQPARESFTARLVAERKVGGLPAAQTFPVFGAAAGRSEHEMTLLASSELDVRPEPGPQARQIAFVSMNEQEKGGFDVVASFAETGATPALAYELRPKTPERSAQANYVFQVSAGKLEISAGLVLHPAPGEDLLDASLGLPAGVTVQGVTGNRLADWWREGDVLRVRFAGATPESTTVALNLTRLSEGGAAEGAVSFTPLTLQGFAKVDGAGLLVAPLSVDTTLRFDKERTTIREVEPVSANRGFTILPPYEIKRGFTFDDGAWTGTAQLAALDPKFDVVWVLAAEANDTHVPLSARVLVKVTRGALTQVVFTTAASAPVLELVEGPAIRELTSAVADGRRTYTATLQTETGDAVLFTVAGELPLAGSIDVPDLDFPGAGTFERFVIVENRSQGRLQTTPVGLEECPRGEVAFLPQALAQSQRTAQYFRARAGWSLTLAVETLETTAAQAAVVLQGEITTSLLKNGDEWVRVLYRLHNRTLQFLPLALPKDAELVSVSVGGVATRADRGERKGVPCFLVPLIQTKPGDLSIEVEAVYRRKGTQPLGRTLKRTLDDPDLPGLTVERTLWTLQLPEGWTVDDPVGGNMTRVQDEKLQEESLSTLLSELASLNSITRGKDVDAKTRDKAQRNAQNLNSVLEKTLLAQDEKSGVNGRYDEALVQELQKQQVILTENGTLVQQSKAAEAAQRADAAAGASNGVAGGQRYSGNAISEEKIDELLNKGDKLKDQTKSQLGLNDNVFWGDTATPEGSTASKAKADDKPGGNKRQNQVRKLDSGKPDDNFNAPELPQNFGGGGDFDAGKGTGAFPVTPTTPETLTGLGKEADAKKAYRSDFNNLDQNRRRSGAEAQMGQKPESRTEPKPASGPQAAPAEPAPAQEEDADQAVDAQLLVTGRASLAGVFPTQPAAAHFKKVKDHAVIEVTGGESARLAQRWPLFAACGGSVLAVLVLAWLTRRRKPAAHGRPVAA